MLEQTIPYRSKNCHICGKKLSLFDKGASFLEVQKNRASISRIDICLPCSDLQKGNKHQAIWHWKKEEAPADCSDVELMIREKIGGKLKEIFLIKTYGVTDIYQYTLLMLLHRAGIVQKRRVGKKSILFSWSDEGVVQKTCFDTVPCSLSQDAYQEIMQILSGSE